MNRARYGYGTDVSIVAERPAAHLRESTTALVLANGVFTVQRRGLDPEARARLVHTADVLTAVEHRGAERLLALEDDGTCTTLVTVFAGGRSLANSVPDRPRRLALIGAHLLRTLEGLHAVGVTHGPLRPSQVRLRDRCDPVLCDFSLGRRHRVDAWDDWAADRDTDIRSVGVLLAGLLAEARAPGSGSPAARFARRRVARVVERISAGTFADASGAADALEHRAVPRGLTRRRASPGR